MITLDNISFSYDGTHLALDGINLHINKGEFVCIAGSNGSGKSTLARHINALLTPTSGYVHVQGKCSTNPQCIFDIRSEVAMVFQNPDDSLVASIVEDEVSFGPGNLGVAPDELRRRVTDCLASVGMQGMEKVDVNTLSGGQKQRIAIASTLAMAPSILVLDEATSMLDPQGRRTVVNIARALHQNGMTVIMITHFMEEALAADRLILMEEGRIVADGKPGQLLADSTLIESVGLRPSNATRLSAILQAKGLSVPITCNEDELKEALCSLYCAR